MKDLLSLLIVINCQVIQVVGDFEWTVIGKATDFGQKVTLFCNVSNCCPKFSGWDRWTPVQRTLFIDVKTGRPNKKYEGEVFRDGYTLIIKNLTKHDLNVSYSCLYGATFGKRKILLEEDVFTYISTTQPNDPSDISVLSDDKIVGIIVGAVAIVAVTIVVFLILFVRHGNLCKERDNGSAEVVSLIGTAKEEQYIDYFLQDPVNVDCIEGGDAMLTCKVRAGSPPAKWLKGSKEIQQNENYIISEVATQQGLNFQLNITNIKRSDSGDYCVEVGQFARTLKLDVKEIPREINDDEKNIFLEAIKSGTEVRKFVRIQVIGKDRVGKTSLVRRLLGYDTYDGTSTDGIEIDRNCQIRTSDGEWIVGNVATEKMERIKRILQTVNQIEKEPVSNQLPPQKPLPTQENILEIEKESNEQEPNGLKNHSQEIEQIEKRPSQNIGTNKYLSKNSTINAADTINLSRDNIDKSGTRDGKEHTEMPDPSFMSRKYKNTIHPEEDDKISEELLIKEMNAILLGAKAMQTEKDILTSEDLVECGIWDFAGQKDYYATHQTFFTAHAIYLLVTDIEDIDKDMKSTKEDNDGNFEIIGDYIDFWFDSVHCLCPDHSPDKLSPPVIMVCTGIDKWPGQEVEKRKKEYEDKFIDKFGRLDKVRHRRGIHFISNKNPSEGEIERLKEHISNIAKEMMYFAEELPTRWIKLENALDVLKDMTRTICSWNNIKELADSNSIPIGELILFLKYQHKIGNIIFFEDKRDCIILQPHWLVKCFRCLVCDDAKKHGGSALVTEMCNLKQKGQLSEKLIDELFDKESDLNFGKYKDHILDVMGKFDIILEKECQNTNNKLYYMPCMIKKSSTLEEVIKNNLNFRDPHRTAWLILEFKFLPIAYFNHVLVNFIRNYRVYTSKSGHPVIYTGKTIVHLDETTYRLLIICFSKNAISLQIYSAEHQIDIDVNDKTYARILRNLCSEIEKKERTLMHTLSYKITAKCSTGDYDSVTGRISIDELNTSDKERYFCTEHGDFHSTKDIKNTWLKHAVTVREEIETRKQEEKAKTFKKVTQPTYWQHKATKLKSVSLCPVGIKEHDPDYLIVAALDFGTSYSGCAFSFKRDFKTNPLKIHANQAWNAGGRQLLSLKTPTTLLLNPDKQFKAFGYEAENAYSNLAMDDDHFDHFLFRRFKMNLHNKKKIGNDLIIEDITGKPMAALDVFTLSIKELVKHLMALLEKHGTGVEMQEIRWVLTVPAIWTDSAKQFMRKGAVQAGIPENKLYIALEPEAASIFCQYLPTEKLKGADFKMAKPGTQYMVVDLGGGTADITVHEKVSNGHLKELSSATGNNCGGTSVDERFLQMFVDIFGRPVINALKEEDPSVYLDLFLEFETVKRIIGPDTDSKVTISIPYVLINRCCSNLLDKDIESVLSASKYANEIYLKGAKMRINPKIIKDIFNPTIQSIVTLMKEICDREQSFEVSQILLVGGFSECSLVQDAIKRAFPDKRIINPDEAGLAVLKGACLFGHKPDYIISRVMQYTYGTGISLPFDANIHDKEHIVKEEDGEFCDGLFEVIVRKNDTVDISTAIEHNFTVDCNDEEPWELSLYASTNEKPLYVDEKGCTLLGSMKISFSKANDTERELRVAFLFGNTELGVTATDILTGETVSSTFNLN